MREGTSFKRAFRGANGKLNMAWWTTPFGVHWAVRFWDRFRGHPRS